MREVEGERGGRRGRDREGEGQGRDRKVQEEEREGGKTQRGDGQSL